MNYNEYIANIKAYKNGTLMQAAPTDALSDWHEKYFDTAVSALSKKMIADHVEHSEDADKFGKDFVSLVAILEEDGVSKQDIGKELEAVSKAAQSQADAAIKKLNSVQHSTDTLEAYKENHLEHGEWKRHKYIRIENGRYIYPEDLKKTNNTSSRNNQVPLNKQISNKITSTLSNLTPKKTTTAPTSPASRDQISGEKYVKNKLNDIATGFKNIAKSVQEYRSESKNAEGSKVEEYVKLANGQTVSKKEYEDELRKNIVETDRQYHEQKQAEKNAADEKAKKEQQARQEEAKKITSMTPDEARKRAEAVTKAKIDEIDRQKADTAYDAQIKEKKTPKERLQSGEVTADQIRDEIKSKSKSMQAEVEEMAKKYVGGATVKATEFEPDTGAPQRFEIRDSNGNLVLDTGNFLLDYDEWNYTRPKKVSHSSDPRAAFYAAVDEYKSKKGLNQRVPL